MDDNKKNSQTESQKGKEQEPIKLRLITMVLPIGKIDEAELMKAIRDAIQFEPSPEDKKIHDTVTDLLEFVGERQEIYDMLDKLSEDERKTVLETIEEVVGSCGRKECKNCEWTRKLIKIIKDKYNI